jgi:hypothetical protein
METIIDRQTLPETILSYIHSENIRLIEKEGTLILSEVKKALELENEKAKKRRQLEILEQSLFDMFADGKLSVEKFIKNKELEKELEIINKTKI